MPPPKQKKKKKKSKKSKDEDETAAAAMVETPETEVEAGAEVTEVSASTAAAASAEPSVVDSAAVADDASAPKEEEKNTKKVTFAPSPTKDTGGDEDTEAGDDQKSRRKLTKAEKRLLRTAKRAGASEETLAELGFDKESLQRRSLRQYNADSTEYQGKMQVPDPDFDPSNNNCRMYQSEFPDKGDLVLVMVNNVGGYGADVHLLEYNNKDGMILLSELTRQRIKSIHKLIRVGRRECVTVLRVDTEKAYIDLSKRRVQREDIERCEAKFKKSKKVHSILTHVSQTCQVPLLTLYEKIGWPLYQKYGHAFEAFKKCVEDPEGKDQEVEKVLKGLDIHPAVKASLLKNIEFRMTPKAVRLRADIEVTCFDPTGIESVQAALRAGLAHSTEENPLYIKLVAPPMFVMFTTSLDKEGGLELLNSALDSIKEEIEKRNGAINIKNKPRAVTESDEQMLKEVMEEKERENREVSGDAEED